MSQRSLGSSTTASEEYPKNLEFYEKVGHKLPQKALEKIYIHYLLQHKDFGLKYQMALMTRRPYYAKTFIKAHHPSADRNLPILLAQSLKTPSLKWLGDLILERQDLIDWSSLTKRDGFVMGLCDLRKMVLALYHVDGSSNNVISNPYTILNSAESKFYIVNGKQEATESLVQFAKLISGPIREGIVSRNERSASILFELLDQITLWLTKQKQFDTLLHYVELPGLVEWMDYSILRELLVSATQSHHDTLASRILDIPDLFTTTTEKSLSFILSRLVLSDASAILEKALFKTLYKLPAKFYQKAFLLGCETGSVGSVSVLLSPEFYNPLDRDTLLSGLKLAFERKKRDGVLRILLQSKRFSRLVSAEDLLHVMSGTHQKESKTVHWSKFEKFIKDKINSGKDDLALKVLDFNRILDDKIPIAVLQRLQHL